MIFGKQNILKEQWNKRYNLLPVKVKNELDLLENRETFTNELIPMIKNSSDVRKGDLIAIQPVEGYFFLGAVLSANICHKDKNHSINGCHVVAIFKEVIRDLDTIPTSINTDLLLSPKIVFPDCWLKGFITSIECPNLALEISNIEYVFYDIVFGRYMTETGEIIQTNTKNLSSYSIATYASLGYEVQRELIIDNELIN